MFLATAMALAAFVVVGFDAFASGLTAGATKVDITNRDAGPVNDPLYAKALVIGDGATRLAIVTVDAVALGEIGYIGNDFLPTVRAAIEKETGIGPSNVLVNASHCHGVVCKDVAERTVQAVKEAAAKMVPVGVGAGSGKEDRISENRRYLLKDGRQADSRRAYPLPADDAYAEVGPIDSEIGVLRIDKKDGGTLAVVYNFAVHPIQGVPSGGNTADLVGFASKAIEENLSDGTIALFLQGCAGDINPAKYKDVDHPHDAEPLGNLLGLSTLRAVRSIACKDDVRLTVLNERIALPRANTEERIAKLEAEQQRLLTSLKGTPINLKTFVPLIVKYNLSDDFPSFYAHRYMHEEMMGSDSLKKLDAENRASIQSYIDNIHTMEELARLQENIRLLRMHQADNQAAGTPNLDVEMLGVRIGEFVLITFPGELTVQIGLDLKKTSPYEHTFVAGYTNGYIYYAPTTEQLLNTGCAQEDCDTILAPEWRPIFDREAGELLKRL
ncbi:MAG: hypothetical protein IT366_00325 [Candidatus Hydrogenedentes bacterium]|nr:hypothetical protein [Candidatus Hydrogenedentota bacterium]